ncbi:MAG: serine/threonine protein kinase [Clostridiales bacterium]|nr:serine/threonine protein kinase [Clostridiales bacterium]
MAIAPGTVIDGKYEVLKLIGRGGMSFVYLAMDLRLNKQWAVKEVRKTASGENNEMVINSLVAEANLMKRLDHPAFPRIVDIIDTGQTLLVVMDYVEGESLDKILKERHRIPQDLVAEWARQLCDALGYLHKQDPPIIYRDMKPANVMLKPSGNLEVIDFGIAREYKEKNLADTWILGTKGYAPPEQRGSRQTDARSDIYALGMTMHHLLTGADPRADDYEYQPIRKYDQKLSDGLERIIKKCTQLDPDNRYQSCDELQYALDHIEEEEETHRKKQKGKLLAFLVFAILAAASLVVGFTGRYMAAYENSRDYDLKINISSSTPYETKVETYLEAIDLFGTDSRAYIKLLEAYSDNNLFGDTQSNQFTGKFNTYKDDFDPTGDDYLDLSYKAGVTYFYLYSGGDDTFRTRVLKACPYFEAVARSGRTDYEYYDISRSYYIIGEFYTRFVVDSTSVKEPALEDYEELLSSLEDCIENAEDYDYDDAAYIKLTMYEEVANLLNSHRKGFASVGVDEDRVLGLLETIRGKAGELNVTQERSISLQDEVMEACGGYVSNIRRAYTNTEERNG